MVISRSTGVLPSEEEPPTGPAVEPEQMTHDDLYMDEDDHTVLKEGRRMGTRLVFLQLYCSYIFICNAHFLVIINA